MNYAIEQPLNINLRLSAQREMIKPFLSADVCKKRFDNTYMFKISFVSVRWIDFVNHLRNNVSFFQRQQAPDITPAGFFQIMDNNEELLKQLTSRFKQMDSDRNRFTGSWQDMQKYVMPKEHNFSNLELYRTFRNGTLKRLHLPADPCFRSCRILDKPGYLMIQAVAW